MKITLIASVLLAANISIAAPTNTTKPTAKKATATSNVTTAKSSKSTDTWQWMKDRMSFAGYISQANEIKGVDIKGSSNGQDFKGSGDVSSSTAMGVQVQVTEDVVWNKFGYNWGWFGSLSLEQSRELDSFKGNANGNTISVRSTAKANFRPWTLSSGVILNYSDKVYFPMGLNYTLYNEVNKGGSKSFDMKPDFGLQAGVGFKVNNRASAELVIRETKYQIDGRDESGADFIKYEGTAVLSGLHIMGRYQF